MVNDSRIKMQRIFSSDRVLIMIEFISIITEDATSKTFEEGPLGVGYFFVRGVLYICRE